MVSKHNEIFVVKLNKLTIKTEKRYLYLPRYTGVLISLWHIIQILFHNFSIFLYEKTEGGAIIDIGKYSIYYLLVAFSYFVYIAHFIQIMEN